MLVHYIPTLWHPINFQFKLRNSIRFRPLRDWSKLVMSPMISIGFYSDLIDICKIEIRYMNLIFREYLIVKSRQVDALYNNITKFESIYCFVDRHTTGHKYKFPGKMRKLYFNLFFCLCEKNHWYLPLIFYWRL